MIKHDKILVIQTAFLGDVILALPMVQTIKNHLPDSKIDFLCVPGNVSVLSNHTSIRNVIPYDKKGGDKIDKFIEALSQIREFEYDVVISPHRSIRSALLTYYSEAKTRIGFERNSLSFLLTHKVPYDYHAHEIHRNLKLAKAVPGINFNEEKVSLKPTLYPADEDNNIVNHLLNKSNLISFAPCSRWFTKQLSIMKSKEIAVKAVNNGYNIALIGGEEDIDYCSRLEKEISDFAIVNLCGKLTPLQSYLVMNKSKAVITVDSAAQHLCAAAGTPILLVYGSTDNSFGFYPLIQKHKIMEINGLPCRPCTDHGRLNCPEGHFKCIEDLNPEQIINELNKLITSE